MELSEIHRWIIIPALQQVPGVANAEISAALPREFSLDLDATELLRYGIGFNEVLRRSTTTPRMRAAAACRGASRATSSAASGSCATSTTSATSS